MSSFARLLQGRIAFAVLGSRVLIAGAVTPAAAFPSLPSGYRALFTYTGVRTDQDSVKAVIFCTNVDSSRNATMLYEFVDFDGTLVGSEDPVIPPGITHTLIAYTVNQGTAFVPQDGNLLLTSDLDTGSVRISSLGTNKVICELQAMDATSNPPTFMYAPRQFTGVGKR